ncbi:MAG TPA: DNA internalization-related competence protein ComEC/Rec2 [Oscillospiraceae bacterium]|nr:DNA internalization-related competence protein ComEC/Rec2 [Oscillospiraceae bacterium]
MVTFLPSLVLTFAAGIALAKQCPLSLWSWICLGTAALAAAIVLTLKKKHAAAVLLLLFLGLGILVYQHAHRALGQPLAPLWGAEAEYQGYIQEVLSCSEEQAQFNFYLEEAVLPEQKQLQVGALIRVSVYRPAASFQPFYGLPLKLRGTIKAASGQRNPGGFDYANFLETENVSGLMSAAPWELTVLAGEKGNPVLVFFARLRAKAIILLQHYLPEEEAQLAAALILGQKKELSETLLTAYQRLGLAHLLAVSGLHVGFVTAFALFVFTRLFSSRWPLLSSLLAALFILAYVFLTGGQPPVWRAALTVLITYLARYSGRESEGLQTLSLVALLLLFFRPLWLFSLAFQLSFAATGSILLLAPRLQGAFRWCPKFMASSLAVSIAALAGVLPLQAAHFGYFSFYTIPLNLLCVPLVGLVVMLGVAGIVSGLVSSALASIFFTMTWPLLALLARLPRFSMRLPAAFLYLPAVHPLWWCIYAAVLLLIIANKSWSLTARRILFVLLLGNLACLSSFTGSRYRQLEVTLLDVGQGLAVHICTPAGQHLLVDAGGGQFATGEQIVLPYLRAKRVPKLAALVLTHPHDDHYGGMQAVLAALPTNVYLSNGEQEDSASFSDLLLTLQEMAIPQYRVSAGYRLLIDGVELKILSPPAKRFLNTSDDANNNSLVISLSYGDFNLLLTGDAEAAALTELLQTAKGKLQAAVLQVPHHGSRNALSPALLREAAAPVAVIAVGNNPFGHPHAETLALLAEQKIDVYRTDLHGAVTITSDGKKWQITPYLYP